MLEKGKNPDKNALSENNEFGSIFTMKRNLV